jgi:hypothetical protein
MPKVSKGIGRGGKRPGAGRKPNAAKIAQPVAVAGPVQSEAEKLDLMAEAQAGALKGVDRLNKIIEHGSEAAAIKATALLLTWGFVTPANAKACAAAEAYTPPAPAADGPVAPPAPQTKREQRRINAEQSTAEGKFAVPEPPRLVVSNS